MLKAREIGVKSVFLDDVDITGGLWKNRQGVNRDKTIPAIYHQLDKTGRLDAWKMNPERKL